VTDIRFESDSLGEIAVPRLAHYGPQTARALANFPVSGEPISSLPNLTKAMALVKIAAARTNQACGHLSADKAAAIERAGQDIVEGLLAENFRIDIFQGGAGTSTNMNVNEVMANRALEHLGLELGRYDVIHPNDHVNMSQSTNDVYPTAIRLAMLMTNAKLMESVGHLASELGSKGNEFRDIRKLGRTQLQDAVPMTLGQEFHAFATALFEDVGRLGQMSQMFLKINLGGTAIGTSINADADYRSMIVPTLAQLSGYKLTIAENLLEASWDTGAFVLYSGMLKRLATKLSKIANDLRLLASGPRGGLCEIVLPAMQPGSSIMPGKVNPVIAEVVNQVAFHVIGADLTVTLASEAGQLQLNAMEPVIAASILNSMRLLINVVDVFRVKCVSGIRANETQCLAHLDASTAFAALLVPVIGYEKAALLAHQALDSRLRLTDLLARLPDDVQAAAFKRIQGS
jgi:aspartate ammonia-lyase